MAKNKIGIRQMKIELDDKIVQVLQRMNKQDREKILKLNKQQIISDIWKTVGILVFMIIGFVILSIAVGRFIFPFYLVVIFVIVLIQMIDLYNNSQTKFTKKAIILASTKNKDIKKLSDAFFKRQKRNVRIIYAVAIGILAAVIGLLTIALITDK